MLGMHIIGALGLAAHKTEEDRGENYKFAARPNTPNHANTSGESVI